MRSREDVSMERGKAASRETAPPKAEAVLERVDSKDTKAVEDRAGDTSKAVQDQECQGEKERASGG